MTIKCLRGSKRSIYSYLRGEVFFIIRCEKLGFLCISKAYKCSRLEVAASCRRPVATVGHYRKAGAAEEY